MTTTRSCARTCALSRQSRRGYRVRLAHGPEESVIDKGSDGHNPIAVQLGLHVHTVAITPLPAQSDVQRDRGLGESTRRRAGRHDFNVVVLAVGPRVEIPAVGKAMNTAETCTFNIRRQLHKPLALMDQLPELWQRELQRRTCFARGGHAAGYQRENHHQGAESQRVHPC